MVRQCHHVGIIGHCELTDDDISFSLISIHHVLSQLKNKYQDTRAISAISKGADSLFAQRALELGIELESIIPFSEFGSDFHSEETYERYMSIKRSSNVKHHLAFTERDEAAYKKSMELVVFKSDIIIAVWNGKEVGSKGGTWEAVCLCKKLRRNMLHINLSARRIDIYFNNSRGYITEKSINIRDIQRFI